MEVSLIVIINQVWAWLSSLFHHFSPNLSKSDHDSPDQTDDRKKIKYRLTYNLRSSHPTPPWLPSAFDLRVPPEKSVKMHEFSEIRQVFSGHAPEKWGEGDSGVQKRSPATSSDVVGANKVRTSTIAGRSRWEDYIVSHIRRSCFHSRSLTVTSSLLTNLTWSSFMSVVFGFQLSVKVWIVFIVLALGVLGLLWWLFLMISVALPYLFLCIYHLPKRHMRSNFLPVAFLPPYRLGYVQSFINFFFFSSTSLCSRVVGRGSGHLDTPSAGSKEGETPASIKALLSGTASVIPSSIQFHLCNSSIHPILLVSFRKLEDLGFKVQGLGFRCSVNTRIGRAYGCLWHVHLVMLEYFF